MNEILSDFSVFIGKQTDHVETWPLTYDDGNNPTRNKAKFASAFYICQATG